MGLFFKKKKDEEEQQPPVRDFVPGRGFVSSPQTPQGQYPTAPGAPQQYYPADSRYPAGTGQPLQQNPNYPGPADPSNRPAASPPMQGSGYMQPGLQPGSQASPYGPAPHPMGSQYPQGQVALSGPGSAEPQGYNPLMYDPDYKPPQQNAGNRWTPFGKGQQQTPSQLPPQSQQPVGLQPAAGQAGPAAQYPYQQQNIQNYRSPYTNNLPADPAYNAYQAPYGSSPQPYPAQQPAPFVPGKFENTVFFGNPPVAQQHPNIPSQYQQSPPMQQGQDGRRTRRPLIVTGDGTDKTDKTKKRPLIVKEKGPRDEKPADAVFQCPVCGAAVDDEDVLCFDCTQKVEETGFVPISERDGYVPPEDAIKVLDDKTDAEGVNSSRTDDKNNTKSGLEQKDAVKEERKTKILASPATTMGTDVVDKGGKEPVGPATSTKMADRGAEKELVKGSSKEDENKTQTGQSKTMTPESKVKNFAAKFGLDSSSSSSSSTITKDAPSASPTSTSTPAVADQRTETQTSQTLQPMQTSAKSSNPERDKILDEIEDTKNHFNSLRRSGLNVSQAERLLLLSESFLESGNNDKARQYLQKALVVAKDLEAQFQTRSS